MIQPKPLPDLNVLIDRFFTAPDPEVRQLLKRLVTADNVCSLAERFRRRATTLAKQHRDRQSQLLDARNMAILHLYAALAPAGWSCAWSDGAVFNKNTHRQAGIGGLLMDSDGVVVAHISVRIEEMEPFGAELAAVATLMDLAIAKQQRKLWLYCDNSGLVRMWNEQRGDPRLEPIRLRLAEMDSFALRVIPRLHNQPANTLAKAAVADAFEDKTDR